MAMHRLQENRSLLGFNSNAGTSGLQAGLSNANNKYNQDSITNANIRQSLLANRIAMEKYNQDNSEAMNTYQSILNEKAPGSKEWNDANNALNKIKEAQGFYQDNELSMKHGIKGGTLTAGNDGRPVLVFGNGVRNTVNQAGLEAIKGKGTGQQLQNELNNRFFGYENGLNENYTANNVSDPNFIKRADGSGNTWLQTIGNSNGQQTRGQLGATSPTVISPSVAQQTPVTSQPVSQTISGASPTVTPTIPRYTPVLSAPVQVNSPVPSLVSYKPTLIGKVLYDDKTGKPVSPVEQIPFTRSMIPQFQRPIEGEWVPND